MIEIRTAKLEDAGRLLEIYDYYVRNTAISFEYETPSLEEFEGRMDRTLEKYPYLVLVKDGEIEGYTYAGPFKDIIEWAANELKEGDSIYIGAIIDYHL